MKAAPYSHPWGASIFAKVLATNEAGPSAFSDPGNGGIILTIPEAPQNLAEDTLITNKN